MRKAPAQNGRFRERGRNELSVATLHMAPFSSPVGKTLQLFAMLPAQMEELAGIELGAFLAQERFKPPLQVGTVPRIESIAAGDSPIVTKHVPHVLGIVPSRQCKSH